jgi:hypothetical protein
MGAGAGPSRKRGGDRWKGRRTRWSFQPDIYRGMSIDACRIADLLFKRGIEELIRELGARRVAALAGVTDSTVYFWADGTTIARSRAVLALHAGLVGAGLPVFEELARRAEAARATHTLRMFGAARR